MEKQESEYNMIDWFNKVLIKNYANFEGRARRSEYWYFKLMTLLVLVFISIFVSIGFAIDIPALSIIVGGLVVFYILGIIIPSIAVTVRRLHDTEKSGWFYLLSFIPFGGIVLFVFCCIEGDLKNNKYGASPKEIHRV